MSSIGEIVIPDSFESLSSTDVLRSERTLGALWSAADPTVDVRTGALQSLLLRPFAAMLESAKAAFRQGGKQSDLAYLLSAPAEQSAELLDVLAQNYRITRRAGAYASGKLRIVLSRRATLSLGTEDTFTANGMIFTPLRQSLVDRREAATVGDAIYYPMPDDSGFVYFDIEVAASTVGAAGNLMKGVEVISLRENIPSFVRAFAAETFTGGVDAESNYDLIQRMLYGISAKVLSSRINMKASLLDVFPDIRDSSIIGAGDEEMTRDKHTVFPGATGGYADWYIATSPQLQTATFTFDHFRKLWDLPDGQVTYAIDLLEEHFPCLYWVSQITDEATNQACTLLSQSKHLAERGADAPRILEDAEGMFTAYQLTDVRFTGPPELQRIKVSGTHMPQLKEIQDWVLRCGQSPLGLDVLVKGAVPVTVQFSAVLNTPMGTEVNFTELQSKVADYVNRIPFDGVLAVSGLLALLHTSLPDGSFVSDSALFALQWLSEEPDAFHVRDRLTLTALPFGTNRTSILYCDSSNVSFKQKFIEGRCS